jgi:hypothetical protein
MFGVNKFVYISRNKNTYKMLTTEEQQMYPKTMIAIYFPNGADRRDKFLELYRIETEVNDKREQAAYYENLCHESNITLMVKLSNGVIK